MNWVQIQSKLSNQNYHDVQERDIHVSVRYVDVRLMSFSASTHGRIADTDE